eukprot:105959_1
MWPIISFIFFVVTTNAATAPPQASCGTMQMQKIGTNSYVCLPNACDYDMCDPGLGTCNNSYAAINSGCEFSVSGNYTGMSTFPYGVSTEYCTLGSGSGCQGGACGTRLSSAVLSKYGVTGIAAVNPAIFGLDENRVKYMSGIWGQGCTTNSSICYYLEGPAASVNVMITDRCAGYCNCQGSKTSWYDCGQCDLSWNDPSKIYPSCPCVGNDGDMYKTCCGNDPECSVPLNAQCDWCAGNNHAHFDLNIEAFNKICGSQAVRGHCVLKQFVPYKCGSNVL